MHKSRQDGFTLAEMISVLVIMAIVLSIAIPAVTNLARGNAVSAASRDIYNTLSLARQFAITHRTNARVVLLYSGSGVSQDMWYHTYSVMTNRDTTNPGGWGYVTKWEYLPTGVVFLDDTGNPGDGSLNDVTSVRIEYLPLPFQPPNDKGTLDYIEFGPTGAATQAGTLTIQQGIITPSFHPQPTPNIPPPNLPPNYRKFVVDNIVGHIQVIAP